MLQFILQMLGIRSAITGRGCGHVGGVVLLTLGRSVD
jgi:hypothetical protein